ncbi:MAG: hypothetical protein ACRYE8_05600 [Janthinobacterium lividum]
MLLSKSIQGVIPWVDHGIQFKICNILNYFTGLLRRNFQFLLAMTAGFFAWIEKHLRCHPVA